jgi:hypothetical protein
MKGNTMNRIVFVGVALVLIAVACGDASTDADGGPPLAISTTNLVPPTSCAPGSASCGTAEGATPVAPGEIVPTPVPLDPPAVTNPTRIARTDLALRLGVPIDHVEFVSLEEVVWRDGNLGCDTGEPAIQVLTDGYQIVFEVHNVQYFYHGKTGLDPVYCATPNEPLPPGDA